MNGGILKANIRQKQYNLYFYKLFIYFNKNIQIIAHYYYL